MDVFLGRCHSGLGDGADRGRERHMIASRRSGARPDVEGHLGDI